MFFVFSCEKLGISSVLSVVELPGQARGWVQEVFPMHNTMVYSMRLAGDSVRQQGTVEGHGQATREQT